MTLINIEGRRVRVSDDFRSLPPEEQERVVEEIAAQLGLRGQQEGGFTRGIGLVNEGIARVGDAMAGPVNRGINAVAGTNLQERPFAGLMDAAGVARTGDPQGLGERALVGAGEAAGALLPAAGVLGAVGRMGGALGSAAQTMRAGLATRAGVAGEMAAGAAAPVGAEIAGNLSGGNPYAEAAGGVLGGLAAGIGVAGIPNALRGAGDVLMRSPITGTAIRTVATAVAPFTQQGGRIIAEDTLRGVTADRFAAADRLSDPNIGNLTPAQQSGDEGLMGIERSLAAADPRFRSALNERTAASEAALAGAAREPAQGRTIQDTKAFFAERRDRHRETVGRYVRQAERRLEAGMRSVQPGRLREDASVWATRVLDEAFERVSREEAQLWNRVPRTVEIGTTGARQALEDARIEATRISEDSIPAKARQFLGQSENALGDTATMGELHRLYSEMRRAGREAMAKPVPDEFTARQANRIAEGILADIEAAEGAGNAARLLADARAYSREVAEQFGQGNVARIVARTRAGDERIPAEAALRSTVGQGRERGGAAVDDLRRAGGEAMDAPVQDFMRDEFTTAARRPDGQVDVAAVERFGQTNREALARFPDGVGRQVEEVRTAASEVVRRQDRMQSVVAALDETRRGTVAGVVNAPKGREIARGILEADNPAAAARAIARAAQRDGTGDAYLGLKAGIVDEVIGRASSNGVISGAALTRVLDDPEMRRVLDAALPAGEVSRLRMIAAQFRNIERSRSARGVDTENLPNNLISTFMQIQAAKAGRAMGTGTIQVPGIFTARAREILGRAFNDRADATIRAALEDPQFMADLLVGPSASRQRIRDAESRMTSWAIGTLAASGEDE